MGGMSSLPDGSGFWKRVKLTVWQPWNCLPAHHEVADRLFSTCQVVYLLLILTLFMFIFALLGMELFKDEYNEQNGFSAPVVTVSGATVPPVKW